MPNGQIDAGGTPKLSKKGLDFSPSGTGHPVAKVGQLKGMSAFDLKHRRSGAGLLSSFRVVIFSKWIWTPVRGFDWSHVMIILINLPLSEKEI